MVKPQGQDPIVFRGDELCSHWGIKRSDDRDLVQAIIRELGRYDILCAHNGVRFDLPFLRTRAARWGLHPVPSLKIIDPVLIARRNLRMSWNSLERLADFLGCNTKTPVDGAVWQRASLDGDREALDQIVAHCIEDVKMLEHIVQAVKGYVPAVNTKGSWT